jgi:gliding motility-associated-like protein
VIANPTSTATAITGLEKTGLYHFVYTNAGGCADTVILKVISTDLEIPNIITPNNDGKNDTYLKLGPRKLSRFAALVFNRWGNEVYRTDNYKNDWSGTGLAEATYYYVS